MWHDICLKNKQAILNVLGLFKQDLQSLTEAIETEDSERITEIFTRAKTSRDQFVD